MTTKKAAAADPAATPAPRAPHTGRGGSYVIDRETGARVRQHRTEERPRKPTHRKGD